MRTLGTWWRCRSSERLRDMVRSREYGDQTYLIIQELSRRTSPPGVAFSSWMG